MKLYLVSGAHHDVPNLLSSAHLTPASADAEALHLVNMIRADAPRDGLDSDEATPSLAALPAGSDWRGGLRNAQRCIVSFNRKTPLHMPLDDDDLVNLSRANVEIVELDVKDVPDAAGVLEDYLAAGEQAANLLSLGQPDGSAEVEAADKLRDALQMMRFAAIWQSEPSLLSPLSPEALAILQGASVTFESPPCQLWASPTARRDYLPGDLLADPRTAERTAIDHAMHDALEHGIIAGLGTIADATGRRNYRERRVRRFTDILRRRLGMKVKGDE